MVQKCDIWDVGVLRSSDFCGWDLPNFFHFHDLLHAQEHIWNTEGQEKWGRGKIGLLYGGFKSGDTFNIIAVSSEVYITGEVLSYHLLL